MVGVATPGECHRCCARALLLQSVIAWGCSASCSGAWIAVHCTSLVLCLQDAGHAALSAWEHHEMGFASRGLHAWQHFHFMHSGRRQVWWYCQEEEEECNSHNQQARTTTGCQRAMVQRENLPCFMSVSLVFVITMAHGFFWSAISLS